MKKKLTYWLCFALLNATFAHADPNAEENDPDEKIVTEEELFANPDLFHQYIIAAVSERDTDLLTALLPVYLTFPERDSFLADYATAILAREEGNLNHAIDYFRALVEEFPDSINLRFQLAQVLYANRFDLEADDELQHLETMKLSDDYKAEVKKLREGLAERNRWRFDGSLSYQYEPNINGAPAQRTFNGWEFEEQKNGHGVNVNVSASKNYPLRYGFFIPMSASANFNWYWNAHESDDLNLRAQSGFGWHNRWQEIRVEPFAATRSFGDKSYSKTYGLASNWRYNFNQQWQLRLYNQTAYEKYDYRKHLNGKRISSGISVIYQATADTYYSAGLNTYHSSARAKEDAFYSYGGNIGGGTHWDNGLNADFNFSVRHKKHRGIDFFNIWRRENTYRLRLGLSHDKLQWQGFQPQLAVETFTTKSNHFYYDRPLDWQSYVEIIKRF